MTALRKSLKIFAISTIVLLCLSSLAPVVAAKAPRSGYYRSQNVTMIVNPDDSLDWSILFNIANDSEYQYTDYNLTWKPFFENHSDLEGILVHSPLVSPLFELTPANQTISTGSFFRMTADQVMDGASEIWWRLPVTDIPANATLTARVFRVSDATNFNLTMPDFAEPLFFYPARMALIHNITLDPFATTVTVPADYIMPNAWQTCLRWQNISISNETMDFSYNYTYMKTNFGLFPNQWYYVQFDIYAPYADKMKLAVSLSDYGEDERFNSWIWINGTSYYLPADLDTAMLLTYGISNGITGIGTSYIHPDATSTAWTWHFNTSIPIGRTLNATATPFFEVVVPFMLNTSEIVEAYYPYTDAAIWITAIITFYQSSDDSAGLQRNYTSPNKYNGTFNFCVVDCNVTTLHGQYIDHVRVDFLFDYDKSTKLKFWGTQLEGNLTSQTGFTDIYVTYISGGTKTWYCIEKQWFVPYGYFGFTNETWVLTNKTIIVIPVDTPDSPLGILEMYEEFLLYVNAGDKKYSNSFELLWDAFAWLSKKWVGLMLEAFLWIIEHPAVKAVLEALMAFAEFVWGLGIWVWDLLEIFIDALEYFTYWAVRIIYSFSIAIVYMVNVFGVISINSALFAVCRTGNGRDFLRSFRLGWKFILAIMTLLISLGILAVSIVGAVVPF